MAWAATRWIKRYGKVLSGEVIEMQPRPSEGSIYGPRFRWSILHSRQQIELASGFADSLEAAGEAADAWVAELASAADGVRDVR